MKWKKDTFDRKKPVDSSESPPEPSIIGTKKELLNAFEQKVVTIDTSSPTSLKKLEKTIPLPSVTKEHFTGFPVIRLNLNRGMNYDRYKAPNRVCS